MNTDLEEMPTTNEMVGGGAVPALQDGNQAGGDYDSDEQGEPAFVGKDVFDLRGEYLDFVGTKQLEIEEQKLSDHYFHGSQWSEDDVKILRSRRQPIITYNRIARKIRQIVGITERLRQDPKAYPRTPRHEEGAEVATATVRYVCDANQFRTVAAMEAKQVAIRGIGGCEIRLIEGDHGDPDIELDNINGEDFFYDPRSIKEDFSDARYMGIARWLDIDTAQELFPEKAEEIEDGLNEAGGSDMSTHSDREVKWFQVNKRCVRLVEHWYRHKGKWCWCFYISTLVLDEGESPFLNEKGKTICRFLPWSFAVDHDGDRYGFIRNMKGPQDEMNQRRSKALHIANMRRLIVEKGAVDDIEVARREWARPDGVIEKNPASVITPDDTRQELEAHLGFLNDAKAEIEQFANVMPNTNGELPKNVSGRALNILQQAGTAEISDFIIQYRAWKIRVYRAIWNTAQRFWTGERWIRVTDDQQLAQFLQVNGLGEDEHGQPAIVNALGSLDVDILLDEGADVINMQADTFDVLSAMAQSGTKMPPQVLIELSPLQGSVKQRVLALLEPPVDPMQAQAKQLAIKESEADVGNKHAQTLERVAKATSLIAKSHMDAQETYRTGLQDSQVEPWHPAPAPPLVPPRGPMPQGAPPMPGHIPGGPPDGFHPQAPMLPPPPGGPGAPGPGGMPAFAGARPNLPGLGPDPVPNITPTAPAPRQSPHDGQFYLPDPNRPGKYTMPVDHDPFERHH